MTQSETSSHPPEVIFVVATHITMLVLLLLSILFVVPLYAELYADGGHWPPQMMFMFHLSDFCKTWILIIAPVVAFLTYVEPKLLSYLRGTRGPAILWGYVFGVILSLSALQVFLLWAMIYR